MATAPDSFGGPPRAFKILDLFGVGFYVQQSFLIFIAVIMLFQVPSKPTPDDWMRIGMFGFVIFISLLVHEGGHAIAARLVGLKDVAVHLVAFGGYCLHTRTTHPRSLVISLAGPLMTSSLIVIGFYSPGLFPALQQYPATMEVFGNLALINIVWLVYNLLPVFPLDGGQSVYHFLGMVRPKQSSVRLVAGISMATAVAVGIAILIWVPSMMLGAIILGLLFKRNLDAWRYRRY